MEQPEKYDIRNRQTNE